MKQRLRTRSRWRGSTRTTSPNTMHSIARESHPRCTTPPPPISAYPVFLFQVEPAHEELVVHEVPGKLGSRPNLPFSSWNCFDAESAKESGSEMSTQPLPHSPLPESSIPAMHSPPHHPETESKVGGWAQWKFVLTSPGCSLYLIRTQSRRRWQQWPCLPRPHMVRYRVLTWSVTRRKPFQKPSQQLQKPLPTDLLDDHQVSFFVDVLLLWVGWKPDDSDTPTLQRPPPPPSLPRPPPPKPLPTQNVIR